MPQMENPSEAAQGGSSAEHKWGEAVGMDRHPNYPNFCDAMDIHALQQ